MIQSFKDQGTEDIFNGENTSNARKTCPETLWRVTARKLDLLDSVTGLHDLNIPPGNHLVPLMGDRLGQDCIHINDHYSLCIVWTDKGPGQVEITGYL